MFTGSKGLPELDRQNLASETTGATLINVLGTLVESLAVFEHIAKTYPLTESTDAQLLTMIAKIREILKMNLNIGHSQMKEAIQFAWLCHAQETVVKIPGGCMTYKHNLVGQTMGRAGFELAVVQILDEILPNMQVEIPENE